MNGSEAVGGDVVEDSRGRRRYVARSEQRLEEEHRHLLALHEVVGQGIPVPQPLVMLRLARSSIHGANGSATGTSVKRPTAGGGK